MHTRPKPKMVVKPMAQHRHTAKHTIARDGEHVQVQCQCGKTWWHVR